MDSEYKLEAPEGKQASVYILEGDLIMADKALSVDDFIILEPGSFQMTGTGSIFEILTDQRPSYET